MQLPQTFHWILSHLYILLWKVYDNCTVCTSVWITKLMLQPRSMKFFWRMTFHAVLFAFSVSALQKGQDHDLQDPIARRILKIWHFVLLTLHSVQITKIYRQLYTFIRHEIHWVQNLHRFQFMNKLQQLSLCWSRIGLRLKISSCLEGLCLKAIASANHSFQTVLQACVCWGSNFQNLIASHLKRSANAPLKSVTSCSSTKFYQNNLTFSNYTVEYKGTQIPQRAAIML